MMLNKLMTGQGVDWTAPASCAGLPEARCRFQKMPRREFAREPMGPRLFHHCFIKRRESARGPGAAVAASCVFLTAAQSRLCVCFPRPPNVTLCTASRAACSLVASYVFNLLAKPTSSPSLAITHGRGCGRSSSWQPSGMGWQHHGLYLAPNPQHGTR
jgi:hypothetical protein